MYNISSDEFQMSKKLSRLSIISGEVMLPVQLA
jgi:hypothetical protein